MVINTIGKVRIFVYGSLKMGQSAHIVLEKAGAERVGRDSITGHYKMLNFGAYPALTFDENKSLAEAQILGEVYAGDEALLAACDLFEGQPDFFKRHKVWCDRYKSRVWVYFIDPAWAIEADDENVVGNCWNPSKGEQLLWKRRGVDCGS